MGNFKHHPTPIKTLAYYTKLLAHKYPWVGDKVVVLVDAVTNGGVYALTGYRVERVLHDGKFVPSLRLSHPLSTARHYYCKRNDFHWSYDFDAWVPNPVANY